MLAVYNVELTHILYALHPAFFIVADIIIGISQ
ncbi:unknown [Prevotella sp. CAG:487]|nr:unknown [Prevotella sp. CAG:487]